MEGAGRMPRRCAATPSVLIVFVVFPFISKSVVIELKLALYFEYSNVLKLFLLHRLPVILKLFFEHFAR